MKNSADQYLLFLFILISSTNISAQQLTPSVVATSGGFYSNTAGSLSFTTGEMSAVETYATPNTILTQGFQQVWGLGTSTHDQQDPPFSFSIYPNPSEGLFNLVFENKENAKVKIRVTDLLGREIHRIDFDQENTVFTHSIDLSSEAQGMYLVTIMILDKYAVSPSYQVVEKIQIFR